MDTDKEAGILAGRISKQLHELENYFFETHVMPGYAGSTYEEPEWKDKETYLFYGTRELFYQICLFLEYKTVSQYLQIFRNRFESIINEQKQVTESRGPLYEESEPSMIILDDFRDFLSPFSEFKSHGRFLPHEGLSGILENTEVILQRTQTKPNSEKVIYDAVRWVIELSYPRTRRLNKARFIRKFKSYVPDILVPELGTAIEYKLLRKGKNADDFLAQIKTDADNYSCDPEYNHFYAVVYYQEKVELIQSAFKAAVKEKKFPENWTIIAV